MSSSCIYTNGKRVRPAWLEVDLGCLAWNVRRIRAATEPGAMICASMKANAYGHGATTAAGVVLQNGADRLSVAILDEALELRSGGVCSPILILGSMEYGGAHEIIENGITQTISSFQEAEALSAAACLVGRQAAIHIKADTGMGRLGFVFDSPAVYDEIVKIYSLPGIYTEGIFTHFAASDEADAMYTMRQIDKFNAVCEELRIRGVQIPLRHCSNSAAIAGFPCAHMDMVRPGIALYGGAGPLPGKFHKDLELRGAMSLRAKITLVKTVESGTCIGYGRRFTTSRKSRIATLPLGYGDGYNRGLSCGKGEVLIKGKRAPIAGTVCMDMFMVDVTDIAGVETGDEAVLFGRQGDDEITLEEISKTLDTIPYEIMCSINRRVPRVYKY